MSEEIIVEKKEKNTEKCFCKCEFVQRTLAVAIGSFIGFYCALNLFCALHKPPMMMRGFYPPMVGHHQMMPDGMRKHKNFDKFKQPENFKNMHNEMVQKEGE